MNIKITLPLSEDPELLARQKAGSLIRLSGILYTARDQAHKRLIRLLNEGKKLPFSLNGNLIYYCGPTPPREDFRFGSAGPTTASRMDPFTPILLSKGLSGTIGKGGRSEKVRQSCQNYRSPYLITFGGAGAYLASHILKQEIIAFEDLGTEAIYRLEIEDFPVIVAYDTKGNSIYD